MLRRLISSVNRENPEVPIPSRECSQCGTTYASDVPSEMCPACTSAATLADPEETPEARDVDVPRSSSASSGPLEMGSWVGGRRFCLVRLLGKGGLGEVWLAEDRLLSTGSDRVRVALKFLKEQIRDNPRRLEEFRKELRQSRGLAHSNLIRIFDWHEIPGEPAFYSMEYVQGRTLQQVQNDHLDRRLSWSELRPLALQLGEALHHAHTSHGLVHSDVKPANVLVDDQGLVRLGDFGMARRVSMVDGQWIAEIRRGGTRVYMSPQQFRGEPALLSDDIYAFGATLYHLLTGQVPIPDGAGFAERLGSEIPPTVRDILRQRQAVNDVPTVASQVIQECLRKDPEQRPRSMADVLRRLTVGISDEEDVPGRSRSHEVRDWLAFGVGLLLLVWGGRTVWQKVVETQGSKTEEVTILPSTGNLVVRWENFPSLEPVHWELNGGPDGRNRRGTNQISEGLHEVLKPGSWRLEARPGLVPTAPAVVQVVEILAGQTNFVTLVWEESAPAKPRSTPGQIAVSWQKYAGSDPLAWRFLDANRVVREEGTAKRDATTTVKLDPGVWRLEAGPERGPRSSVSWMSQSVVLTPGATVRVQTEWLPGKHQFVVSGLTDSELVKQVQIVRRDGWETKVVVPTDSFWGTGGGNSWTFDGEVLMPGTVEYRATAPRKVPIVVTAPVIPGTERGPVPVEFVFQPSTVPTRGDAFTVARLSLEFMPVGDFWAARTEVTVGQFRQFAERSEAPLATQPLRRTTVRGQVLGDYTWTNAVPGQTDQHPVVGVSWKEAQAFAEWLTRLERAAGRLASNQRFSLPTDAQWNQMSGLTTYPWGDRIDQSQQENLAGEEVRAVDWPEQWTPFVLRTSDHQDPYSRTAPVGSFAPNARGLFDVGGNVAEWCEDPYQPDLNDPAVRALDPDWQRAGPGRRVVRGGHWADDDEIELRRTVHRPYPEDDRNDWVGFRLLIVETSDNP